MESKQEYRQPEGMRHEEWACKLETQVQKALAQAAQEVPPPEQILSKHAPRMWAARRARISYEAEGKIVVAKEYVLVTHTEPAYSLRLGVENDLFVLDVFRGARWAVYTRLGKAPQIQTQTPRSIHLRTFTEKEYPHISTYAKHVCIEGMRRNSELPSTFGRHISSPQV